MGKSIWYGANLADGVTGVMLRLEIQEKKSDMADKDWSALPAGTAWLLRLCEPYFGSHRIVRADSAFTSTTAAVLLGKRGLFLQGIVKGATKEFPAKYLDNCQYQRGDHHAATATIEVSSDGINCCPLYSIHNEWIIGRGGSC